MTTGAQPVHTRLKWVGVLLTLVASAVLAAEIAPLNPKGPSTIGVVEWRKSDCEKIEYPDVPKQLPDWIKEFCQKLIALQVEQQKSWGMAPFPKPAEPYTWEAGESRKQAFWKEAQAALPDEKLPDYTPHAYEHFMAWSLPRLTAPYGIHAIPLYRANGEIKKPEKPYLQYMETVVTFYPVEKIERENVMRWGKMFRRDKIWIGEALWLDDQPALKRYYRPSAGSAYFQSIFLFRPELERPTWDNIGEKEQQNRTNFIAKFEKVRNVDLLPQVLKSPTPEKAAIDAAYVKTTLDKITPPETFDDELSRVLEHETRHVVDFQDLKLRAALEPLLTSLTEAHFMSDNSKRTHFEINGGLAELRYAKRKDESIRRLALLERQPRIQNFPHDESGRWVLAKMVELATKDPARYGLAFDGSLPLSLKGQFLLQLADLPDNVVERLADDIIALHSQSYDEDFGGKFLAFILAPKPQ